MIATILYAEVYAICFLVVGLLLGRTVRDGDDSLTSLWFRGLLTVFAVNFAVNFLFTLFNGGVFRHPVSHFVCLTTKSLYHVSLALGVAAWGGYAMADQGISLFRNGRPDLRYLLLFCPTFLNVLQNLFTGTMFTVEDGRYIRRGMFHVQMIYLLLIALFITILLFRRSKKELDPARIRQMSLTASFPLCIAAAWILSFVGEAVPVICVCVMFELLCIYFGHFTQQISMDKLTQVNNRLNLVSFLDYKIRNHSGELYLLILDLDGFKQINDTYGHLEGDRALVRFATAVKAACGPFPLRPYIARYGGDEFVVVMEASEEGEVAQLTDLIRQELEKQNRLSGTAYRLAVSIGTARCVPGMTPNSFFAAADDALYRVKDQGKMKSGDRWIAGAAGGG